MGNEDEILQRLSKAKDRIRQQAAIIAKFEAEIRSLRSHLGTTSLKTEKSSAPDRWFCPCTRMHGWNHDRCARCGADRPSDRRPYWFNGTRHWACRCGGAPHHNAKRVCDDCGETRPNSIPREYCELMSDDIHAIGRREA